MTDDLKTIDRKIDELIKSGKPKIAFGLAEPNDEILNSLRRCQGFVEIILVGPKAIGQIQDFELIIDDNPEQKIAAMLVNNEIDGIIRGTIDDFKTAEIYEKLTGEKTTYSPAIMESPLGHRFLLGPASNPEGWEKKERLKIAQSFAEFLKEWEINPKIAVFTGERHETYPRKKQIREGVVGILNKTYEDAEWVVESLKKEGYDAKNWAIDLNPAVEAGCNILIPVNGMVGNQIFRVLLFCGGKVLIAPRMGLSRCYEDNSRTEKDFEYHVKWLVAWINSKKKQ